MTDLTLAPPPELDYGIRVDKYTMIAEEFSRHCRELAGLGPEEHILDVGCGFAPLAAGLVGYLSPQGRYLGLDAVPNGVEWAARTITPVYPNFRFAWVDTYNQTYHRSGQLDPRSLRWPVEDGEFDLVYLRSVFTHMPPEEVDHYLSEIRRVLRPGGRCLITYFMMTEESVRLMSGEGSWIDFAYDYGHYRRHDPGPVGSFAYTEEHIRQLYRKHRLKIVEPIHPGYWCGREEGDCHSSQDIIIATKPEGD
jgi:ubiquinone/menaquinone biosynthesis C-methylase UbiE